MESDDLNTRLRYLRPSGFKKRTLSDASDATVVPVTVRKSREIADQAEKDRSTRSSSLLAGPAAPPAPLSRTRSPRLQDSHSLLPPRALQVLLISLQLLSLVPAFIGVFHCIYRAFIDQDRRRVEWLLSAIWAGLSGSYCHSMARGLTRRWLVYYPLPAAIIRLVSRFAQTRRPVCLLHLPAGFASSDLLASHEIYCRSILWI